METLQKHRSKRTTVSRVDYKNAGVQVRGKDNHDFERRVGTFFTRCEWVLLRTLVFIVFAYELLKFAVSLWR